MLNVLDQDIYPKITYVFHITVWVVNNGYLVRILDLSNARNISYCYHRWSIWILSFMSGTKEDTIITIHRPIGTISKILCLYIHVSILITGTAIFTHIMQLDPHRWYAANSYIPPQINTSLIALYDLLEPYPEYIYGYRDY